MRYRALAAIATVALLGQAAAGTYRVQRGDTLSRVAKQQGATINDLVAANGIKDPDFIREGQLLTIPGKAAPAPAPTPATDPTLSTKQVVVGAAQRTHVVAKGENLHRIATAYGATVADLATANNIKKPNLVRTGTTLTVPGAAQDWLCPVQGKRWFQDSWGAPRPGGRRHLGTDIFAFRGTPVVAPVGGTLRFGTGKIGGNAFYLQGDDGNVYYGAHLDRIDARPGRIERGGGIGAVGSTGNAEGLTPHLHFEIHLGGTEPVNPYYTVKRWC